jgi:hypothetical protein
MFGATSLRLARRRVGCAVLGLLIALALALVFAPKPLAAQGPYEPNDTILNAAGPLAANQTYVGGIESQGDMDYFFFYVTSPGEPQVTLTVRNLGGGTAISNIDVAILDSSATPVGGLSYINRGQEKTAMVTLRPQKYFIEVRSTEGFGDMYSLTGGDGAFGPYEAIAARCANATAAVTAAQTGLRRAQAKLQRASARLRLTRYGTRQARKSARRVYRRARARVTAKKDALKAAKGSQKPWCSIPQ